MVSVKRCRTSGAQQRITRLVLLSVVLIDVVAIPSAFARPAAVPLGHGHVRVTTSIRRYSTDREDTMTTFAPVGRGRHAAVLFVHGGAWGRALPEPAEIATCRRLAAKTGWVVSVIGYETKTSPERRIEPAAVRAALVALSRRRDVDPTRVAVWGESAGGQLALLTAYRDAQRRHPLVRAVVSVSGPTDMAVEYTSHAQTWLDAVTNFEGVTPDQAAARGSNRYYTTSPDDLVTATSPATFQAISAHDPLVPPVQIGDLAAALRANGVPHETVRVPGAGHSYPIEFERPAGSDLDVQQLAISFLRARFARAG